MHIMIVTSLYIMLASRSNTFHDPKSVDTKFVDIAMYLANCFTVVIYTFINFSYLELRLKTPCFVIERWLLLYDFQKNQDIYIYK